MVDDQEDEVVGEVGGDRQHFGQVLDDDDWYFEYL